MNLPPPHASKPRRRAMVALCLFFVLMLAITLAARTVRTLSVPQVNTVMPQRMALTKEYSGVGVVTAAYDVPVLADAVYEGVLIDEVLVVPGQGIETGDPLVRLNIEQLMHLYDEALVEYQRASLLLEMEAIPTPEAPDYAALENERREREYAIAAQRREWENADAEKAVSDALSRMGEARLAVDEAIATREKLEKQTLDEAKTEYRRLVAQVNDQIASADYAMRQNAAAQEDSLLQSRRHVEDCESALATATDRLAASPDDVDRLVAVQQAETALARAQEDLALTQSKSAAALSEAQRQYDAAVSAQSAILAAGQNEDAYAAAMEAADALIAAAQEELRGAQTQYDENLRATEEMKLAHSHAAWLEQYERRKANIDAGTASEQAAANQQLAALQEELRTIDIAPYQSRVDALALLLEDDGVIFAGQSGTVTETCAIVGQPAATVLLRVAPDAQSSYLHVSAPSDDVAAFSVGDAAQIRFSAIDQTVQTAIMTIYSASATADSVEIRLPIAPDNMRLYAGASVLLRRDTPVYSCVLPLSAIRVDAEGHYVLVMRRNDDDRFFTAKRVAVKIIDENGRFAAVEGGLSAFEQCISNEQALVMEGDTVQPVR